MSWLSCAALQGNADGFGGEFTVPSYRGSTFLDPKGRGAATGYDTAVALPASGDDGACMAGGVEQVGQHQHCWHCT